MALARSRLMKVGRFSPIGAMILRCSTAGASAVLGLTSSSSLSAQEPQAPPARVAAPAAVSAASADSPPQVDPVSFGERAPATAEDEVRDAARRKALASGREKNLSAAKAYFSGGGAETTLASAQSLDVANEALQIVGQIIADRASGAAVELLLTKLKKLLACSSNTEQFPRTCSAIDAVRLTDLAGSGRALLDGLLGDAVAFILARGEGEAQMADPIRSLTVGRIPTIVLPELLRAADGRNTKAASALIVKRLMEAALRDVEDPERNTADAFSMASTKGRQVVLSAAVAFAECVRDSKGDEGVPLDRCPVSDHARKAAEEFGLGDDEAALFAALELASDVVDSLTLRKGEGPDWNGRAASALGVTFTTTCLLTSPSTLETCPPVLPPHAPTTWVEWFSTAHAILISALDRDVNGVLVGIGRTVGGEQKQGIRLLGGVLRYSQTYLDAEIGRAAAHQQRAQLLEDLTTEMTDRSGREGDEIWSLGGALQLALGGRIPLEDDEDPALYGPLSLPVGIGFQKVGGGIHLGLGIVDLGQYVSWKPGLEVAKPSIEDALSPSITLGYAWGKAFPAFVAGNVGYAPHYHFSDATSRGSIDVGLSVGVYVPLIDLN